MNKTLAKLVKELEPKAKFVMTWNGYDAYIIPFEDVKDGQMVGRPDFILAKREDVRYATVDERDSILTKMPDEYYDEIEEV